MTDGVLYVMVVGEISRARFLQFVGDYSVGNYHKAAAVARCVPAREVIIESLDGEDVITCLDGEIVHNRAVTIRLSEHKLRFFGPQGCDPDATAEEKRS